MSGAGHGSLSPRIGRVRAADLLPTLLRQVAFMGAIRPAELGSFGSGSAPCVKCGALTTRRLDRDVGIHEECER